MVFEKIERQRGKSFERLYRYYHKFKCIPCDNQQAVMSIYIKLTIIEHNALFTGYCCVLVGQYTVASTETGYIHPY